MCTLYRLEGNRQAIARIFGADWPADLKTAKDIYPDRLAPIIRANDASRHVEAARWGVPPPPQGDRPVVNIRNLSSPFWRGSLAKKENRCLVPATAFSEWTFEPDPVTGKKRKHWFALADGAPFAFAGMTRRDTEADPDIPAELVPLRFAFLTTAPNELVAAIHPKAMPVVLVGETADAWLDGVPAEALADALPADRMVMLD